MRDDITNLLDLSFDEQDELRKFDETHQAFDDTALIDDLIFEADTDNSAIACVFKGIRHSRTVFLAQVTQIACTLQAKGVRRGHIVAIILPPSDQRLMLVLAVLRCGAAFLPLDMEQPAERLLFQIKDSQAYLVLTDLDLFPGEQEINSLSPSFCMQFTGRPFHPPQGRYQTDPAYIIYTSGSTGQPKAAVNSHRALVNRLQWMTRYLSVGATDRICHKTSFGFDVSVWEQLLPLLTGSCIVISEEAHRRDPAALKTLIREEQISIIHFVPSMLSAFLEYGDNTACASLRAVISSGEELPRPVAAACSRALGIPIYNFYGPTEAAIDVTACRFDPHSEYSFVPIGKPIDNVRIYILDAAMTRVPIGVTGELYIGGEAVGGGYLFRAVLSAERFLPDPFTDKTGDRMYRTGDLARLHKDGMIEYVGRTDNQVKIRGYRIEMGEIEKALLDFVPVKQAAVIRHVSDAGALQLVAFIAGENGVAVSESSVRKHLSSRLPAYMQPAFIFTLPALPVTLNGKLDRKGLMNKVVQPSYRDGRPPETAKEKHLAAIWEELLKCPVTSVDMNFFQLGGDSITAIRVVIAAGKRRLDLQVKDIFDHPVLADLSQVANEVLAGNETPPESILTDAYRKAPPGDRSSVAPLAFIPVKGQSRSLLISHLQRLAACLAGQGFLLPEETGMARPLADTARLLTQTIGARKELIWAGAFCCPASPADEQLLLAFDPAMVDRYSMMRLPFILAGQIEEDWSLQQAAKLDWEGAPAHFIIPSMIPVELSLVSRARISFHEVGFVRDVNWLRDERKCEALIGIIAAKILQVTATPDIALVLPESRSFIRNNGFSTRALFGRIAAVFGSVMDKTDLAGPLEAVMKISRARCGIAEAITGTSSMRLRTVILQEPVQSSPEQDILACLTAEAGISANEILLVIGRENLDWRWDSRLGDWPAKVIQAIEVDRSLPSVIHEAATWRFSWDFPLSGLSNEQMRPLLGHLGGSEDLYPLAPLQEGLLLRTVYWPGSDMYLNQNVIELQGDLNIEALTSAWNMTVHRHEILRTGYLWQGLRTPLQYVADKPVRQPVITDWSGLGVTPADIGQRLDEYLAEDRKQLFDMEEAGLFRLVLARTTRRSWLLIWTHHHILLDGWCLALIWGDVFRYYKDLALSQHRIYPSPRPYRDYIAWLKQHPPDLTSKKFWKNTLSGFAEPAFFSALPPHIEGEFITIRSTLTSESAAKLKQAAALHKVTLNAYVQSSWALLLALTTGKDDVIHGVSVSGRPPRLTDAEHIVGLFINTIPLRTKLHPSLTLRQLLQDVQQSFAAANTHAHLPLSFITSQWEGRMGGNDRLFDNLIAFENYPDEHLPAEEVAGIIVQDRFCNEKTEYPIGLIVLPGPPMEFHFNYDSTHFSSERMGSLMEDFYYLLDTIVNDPGITFAELVPPSLQLRMDQAARPAFQAVREEQGLCGPIWRWVESQGHEPAITDGNRSWTYRQLAESVRAHACALSKVCNDDMIVLFLERSVEYVIMVLAAWEANLVPMIINPALPDSMIAGTLGKKASPLIAVSARQRSRILQMGFFTRIYDFSEQKSDCTNPDFFRPATSPYLAAILLTSGTSGVPKQVAITSAGLMNRIRATIELYEMDKPCLLANAAPGFDIGLWEFLFPLAQGGKIILASDETMMDPDDICALVEKFDVNTLHIVPSLGEQLLSCPGVDRLKRIRLLITGGETVGPAFLRRAFSKLPKTAIWQGYGPTETSITVLDHRCTIDDLQKERIPLGSPANGCVVYVLDEAGRPCPPGVTGMICIGGICLAAGYLGEPGRTAEAFTPDPFGLPGSRLYQTGDMGMVRPDRTIEFCGRRDRQVKIRGFRVEPALIEFHLAEHPLVRQAYVTAIGSSQEDRRLLAYVTLTADPITHFDDPASLLSDWLTERLPVWARPSQLYIIEAFPLTSNGKIDGARLTETIGGTFRPPTPSFIAQSPEEEIISVVWQEILGAPPADRHANFFAAGGHSLSAMRFVLLLQSSLGMEVKIPVPLLFKYSTPAALAEVLSGLTRKDHDKCVYTIGEGTGIPLVLVHPVEGTSMSYRVLPELLPDRNIMVIDDPRFDQDRGFSSLKEMAGLYVSWVRHITKDNPVILGGWSFGGVVALEMARQMADHGQCPALVIMIDSYDLAGRIDLPAATNGTLRRIQLDDDTDASIAALFNREIRRNELLALTSAKQRYEGKVLLLQASVRDEELDRDLGPMNGWRADLFPAIRTSRLPGDHYGLLNKDNAPFLANIISESFQAVEGNEVIDVRYNKKPFDIFVLDREGIRLVGCKNAARLDPETPNIRRKCCLVEPGMILGELVGIESGKLSYQITYRKRPKMSDAFFSELSPMDELSYPLLRKVDGNETAKSDEFWTERAADPADLDEDEIILRSAVCQFLAPFLHEGQIIYDPACSSGTFLACLKAHYPGIRTVGQDRNLAMINIAKDRVDDTYCMDSMQPAIAKETASVVICRHLNLDVVTSGHAKALFRAAAGTLHKGGLMIVIGHTPVLVDGEWIEGEGFTVLNRVGFTASKHAIFQLYALKKN